MGTETFLVTGGAGFIGSALCHHLMSDVSIRLVNVERDKAGCGSVRLNTKLRTAMRLHVQELEHLRRHL